MKNKFDFYLTDYIERYLNEVVPNKDKKYIQSAKVYSKFWQEKLGHRIAHEITSLEIEQIANSLYEQTNRLGVTYSPESRRKYIQYLGHVYNYAIRFWKWTNINPVIGVDLHIKAIKKTREHKVTEDKELILEFKKTLIETLNASLEKLDIRSGPSWPLVRASGISKSSLQQIFHPEKNVSLNNILKLCKTAKLKLIICLDHSDNIGNKT